MIFNRADFFLKAFFVRFFVAVLLQNQQQGTDPASPEMVSLLPTDFTNMPTQIHKMLIKNLKIMTLSKKLENVGKKRGTCLEIMAISSNSSIVFGQKRPFNDRFMEN